MGADVARNAVRVKAARRDQDLRWAGTAGVMRSGAAEVPYLRRGISRRIAHGTTKLGVRCVLRGSAPPSASAWRAECASRTDKLAAGGGEALGTQALDLAALGDDRGGEHAERDEADEDRAGGVDLGRHAE